MADDGPRGARDDEDALRLPSLRSALRRGRKPQPPPATESAPDDSTSPVQVADRAAAPRVRRSLRIHVPGRAAAAGTGVVVGLALVGLTSASLHLCRSLRGTSSCGTPGILLLLVITAAAVLLGSLLLRLAGVATHGTTSLLGVALVAVLTLLALLPVLDHWWVVIAVPLLSMVCFLGSWWLTTTYADV